MDIMTAPIIGHYTRTEFAPGYLEHFMKDLDEVVETSPSYDSWRLSALANTRGQLWVRLAEGRKRDF